ncbi:MAG: PAC2 family protein [Actinomycetaceae bacterium]|nr:PAC2 family protein [Actinomycetaceae bacterium]
MSDHPTLHEDGVARGQRAPVLVTHLQGAIDAGIGGRLAVTQLLRSPQVERVATFDSDELLDYRSHRPIMTVENWVTTGMAMPEIALDLVRDDVGRPFLLLHGPEPDMRWSAFADAVADLANEAGVEVTVSLHGIPAGTPHTRPTPVHIQGTTAGLVPEQGQVMTELHVPAPATSFLQTRLAENGIDGIALLAAVPYYMAEQAYPAASAALLRRLGEFADLSLPVGDLEQGAAEEARTIEGLLEDNHEVRRTVEALERHYDTIVGAEGVIPLTTLAGNKQPATPSDMPEVDSDIGDVLQAYLATVSATQSAAREGETLTEDVVPAEPETVEDVLRRLAARENDPNAPRRQGPPRHRAADGDS